MPQLPLEGPLPGKIADLQSLVMDLEHVGRLARLAGTPRRETYDAESDELLSVRAHWEAAIIGYRRCFTTGKGYLVPHQSRPTLDEQIEQLDDRLRTAHKEFLAQADRHVAHRVSDLQQILVLAFVTAPPLEPDVGVTWFGMNFVGPAEESANDLSELCALVAGPLAEERDALVEQLLAECRRRLLWCYEHASPRLDDRIAELAAANVRTGAEPPLDP